MISKIKISLSVPNAQKASRYFSLSIKHNLYNERCEFQQPEKVFVISDIEGDFQSFCKFLFKNGVIDKYFNWIFGNNHLVVLGDCFDRGEKVAECLWLIYSLEEKAKKEGGHVHFVLGNHEVMNMNGDWRYVHPKYAQPKKSASSALYYGNNELWRWLCTKNIMEKIGDTLFVHGGISPAVLQFNLSINEINNIARPYYFRTNEITANGNPVLYTLFHGEQSPFWYRGYYQGNIDEGLIDATLNYFGVKTIVTGHTVVEQVSSFFNGKIINIDTHNTSGISGALMIYRNKFYNVDENGKNDRIK